MGDVESWMEEKHIVALFKNMSKPKFLCLDFPVDNVKIIRDKVTGNKQSKERISYPGYCFVDFESTSDASYVLETYNGKPIPNTKK
jgi:RNA recognition motif-containing protein